MGINRHRLQFDTFTPLDFNVDGGHRIVSDSGSISDTASSDSGGTVRISAPTTPDVSDSSSNKVNTHGQFDMQHDGHTRGSTSVDEQTKETDPYNSPDVLDACTSSPSTSQSPSRRYTLPTSNKHSSPRKVRWDPQAKLYEAGNRLGKVTTKSLPNLRESSSGSDTALDEQLCPPPKSIVQNIHDERVLPIYKWDMSGQLYTAVNLSPEGKLQIYHGYRMSLFIPKPLTSTKRVSFCLVISGVLQDNCTRIIPSGEESLCFDETFDPRISEYHEAEITILRDAADLEKSLNLYFHLTMSKVDPKLGYIAALPNFRPQSGKVKSESVFVAEPLPPLTLKFEPTGALNTWKFMQPEMDRLVYLERTELPKLFPEGLKDSVRIRILQAQPTRFRLLEAIGKAEAIWNFHVNVQQPSGSGIECLMHLTLHVGDASTLLTIKPHGWLPKYSLIDGFLATQAGGEWVDVDGAMVLLKQSWMTEGPLHISITWAVPSITASDSDYCSRELLVPSILHRHILGGTINCKGVGVAYLTNSNLGLDSHCLDPDVQAPLPDLRHGYRLYVLCNPRAAKSAPTSPPESRKSSGSSVSEPSETSTLVTQLPSIREIEEINNDTGTKPSELISTSIPAEDFDDQSQPATSFATAIEMPAAVEMPEDLHDAVPSDGSFRFFLFQVGVMTLLIFGCMMGFQPIMQNQVSGDDLILGDVPPSMLGYTRGGQVPVEKHHIGVTVTQYDAPKQARNKESGKDEHPWRDMIDHAFWWQGPPDEV